MDKLTDKETNLQILERLTDKLPLLPGIIKHDESGVTEYATIDAEGTCFGVNLFNCTQVAVQRCFMSANTEIMWHNHNVLEMLVVYSGELHTITKDGDTKILKIGDIISFKPTIGHSVRALKDTWMIAITIPAASGYPRQ